MSWSKIQYTELATEAYVLMNENAMNGCEYHNNYHIDQVYQYLEETEVPYDEVLDWAVMFHDVVYDDAPKKEERSATAFFEMSKKYSGCNLEPQHIDAVQLLIMETVNHVVTPECYLKGSAAIIRADLHALTNKVETVKNFTKIMSESMNLYGCTVDEFAERNMLFMEGLRETMMLNILALSPAEGLFYVDVIGGIDLTVRLAQAIKSD